MNLLDMRTVILSYMISNVICASVMVSLWFQNRRRFAGLGFWLIDFILQVVWIILIALRGILPDFASIIISNILLLGGTILLYFGLERYFGKTSSHLFNYILFGLFICIHLYFTLAQNSLKARNLNITAGLLVIFIQCAWLLLGRLEVNMRAGARGASLVFVAFSLTSIVRILVDWFVPQGNDFFKSGAYDTFLVLVYQVLYIALTFSLVLMVNQRLFNDLNEDIAQRKQTERALKASQEKFSKAFRSSPYAIILTQLSDGRILEVNDGFVTITGYPFTEVIGKTTPELHLWANDEDRAAVIQELGRNMKVDGREFQFQIRSGQVITGRFWAEILLINEQPCVLSTIEDITHRQMAEKALRESEARYRSLFENMLEGFAYCQMLYENGQPLDFIYLKVNDQFERLTGLANVAGKRVTEAIPGVRETNPELFEVYSRVALTGRPESFETYLTGLDNWFSISVYSPQKEYFVAVFEIITARKKAEESLRQSEERFRALFEQAAMGVALLDTKTGRFCLINQKYCDFLGYSQKEMLNKSFKEVTDPETVQENIDNNALLISGKIREFSIEKRYIRKDGKVVWGNLTASPLWKPGETPDIYSHVAIVEDITRRKQAEDDLKQSEERFRLTSKSLSDVIYEWDLKESIQWFGNVDELLGYAPGEFPRTLEGWTDSLHPQDRQRVLAAIESHLLGEAPYDVEYRVRCKDGDWRHWLARGSALRNGSGQPYRWVGAVTDVTERKQYEAEIASLAKFPSENPYPVLRIQPDGMVMYANQAAQELLDSWEYPRGKEALAFWQEVVSKSFEEQSANTLEVENRGRIFSMFIVPVRGENYANIYGLDVTERKRAEDALRESEDKFKYVFDNSVVGKSITFPSGEIHPNKAFCELLGYSPEELQNLKWQEISHPDDIELTQKAIEPLLSGEKDWTRFIKRYICKDGSVVWTDVSTSMRRDPVGKPLYFMTTVIDITERIRAEQETQKLLSQVEQSRQVLLSLLEDQKQAEEEIRKLNAGLEQRVRERTAELSDLYNNAPCGYHSLDENGKIILMNDTELNWLGYEREEIVGKLNYTDLLTPDNVQTFQEKYQIFKQRGWDHDLEFDLLRKDGSILPVLLSRTAVFDQDGHYVMSRSTIVDLTERRRAEAVIRESQAGLEAVNKELESFSYSVSHDLRAPLRGIDGWSLALLEDYYDQLDETARQYLTRVRSEAQRMGILIDDLLQFSRVTRAGSKRELVDLSALAQAVVARLQEAQPGRPVKVTIQPGLAATGDPALFEILLTNLLNNAWKFTAPRPLTRIEFGQTQVDGRKAFYVRDNGVGFDMAYHHKLFGVFQRLHKSSEFPGTGIGLATVQRIIQRFGGQAWAEAKIDRGATFYFTIEEAK